jgi:nucleotide-binding universal stress UspA family protein
VLKNPQLILLAVGLILIASTGKFLGAFIGGKLGGLSRAEALALGCGMNARGSTEVIVASIGLSMSVLNRNLYTIIVTMAIVTTMTMPTMLRWALKRLPLREKERQRLEREELDAKGFVTNLERLLLATDDSPNGRFAAHLAGVIAGSGGKPTTIVDVRKKDLGADAKSEGEDSEQQVKSAAESVTTLEAHPDEEKQGSVEVTTRQQEAVGSEAVAGEAHKGYDLLVVGIAKMRDPKGGFGAAISRITKGFEGPLAVVDSQRKRHQAPGRLGRILVPVNGTEVSRRAAEIALTLARASDAQVTALYVTRANAPRDRRNNGARRRVGRRNEQAALTDIASLGDRYEVEVRGMTRINTAPEEAILGELKRGYDLIVLGVSRRTGDTLFFGDTAASVLARSETANLFVAS